MRNVALDPTMQPYHYYKQGTNSQQYRRVNIIEKDYKKSMVTLPINKDTAHRIIITASYSEKQQGLVDAMLCTWSDLEEGAYGFSGYDNTYKAIAKLTEDQQIEVAQAIYDRREDARGGK